MTPRTAFMFSELNAGRSEAAAAGPSRSGGAPVAEMGGDLWLAQAADVYSADWNQQEDGDARFPVRPTLFLTPTLSPFPRLDQACLPHNRLGNQRQRSTYISSHAHTFLL